MPQLALLQPLFVGLLILSGLDKILHLHLFELPHAENKLTGHHLIPESFPGLGDTERNLLTGGVQNIFIVDKNTLRRLRPQVDRITVITGSDRSELSLEHQVELRDLSPVTCAGARTTTLQ